MKYRFASSASMIALCGALTLIPAAWDDKAYATTINGSDVLLGGSVTVSGGVGDLLSATSISLGNQLWSVTGDGAMGNFTNIAIVGTTPFTYGSTITGGPLNLGNLGAYSFTSADGSFAAVPSLVIGASTYTPEVVGSSGSLAAGSESLSVYLVGNFTPSPTGSLSGFTAGNASETISFTETGIVNSGAGGNYGALSVSASFASPAAAPPAVPTPTPTPTPTPEPASMLLLGAGLAGIRAVGRRRGGVRPVQDDSTTDDSTT